MKVTRLAKCISIFDSLKFILIGHAFYELLDGGYFKNVFQRAVYPHLLKYFLLYKRNSNKTSEFSDPQGADPSVECGFVIRVDGLKQTQADGQTPCVKQITTYLIVPLWDN